GKCFQYPAFQALSPITENKALIATNKEMQMIRHDHVSAYCDIEFLYRSRAIQHESSVSCFQKGKPAAMQCACGEEKQWRRRIGKYVISAVVVPRSLGLGVEAAVSAANPFECA